jgi:hypothetical protein
VLYKEGFLSLILPSFLFSFGKKKREKKTQVCGSHHEAESISRDPGKKPLTCQLACGTREVIILSKVR